MKRIGLLLTAFCMLYSTSSFAKKETFAIDTAGAHAFIQFKVSHLGYSWIYGRFNTFDGAFVVDRDDFSKSSISLTIDPASVDSNHAERDKHIREEKFLDVKKHSEASFVSTKIIPGEGDTAVVVGNLTLYGTTKPISIDIKKVGEGPSPWGDYRLGYEGTTSINPKDFGITNKFLAPLVEFDLVLEGIRQ